jgi:hypothetical protein
MNPMFIFSLLGISIIFAILVDAFETIILPRRVNRRIRLSRLYYRGLWNLWKKEKKLFKTVNDTKAYLGVFGPLSLIILICLWAIALILGFALLNFGIQTDIQSPFNARNFITYFDLSGGTFFPVGIDGTYPVQIPGEILSVIEGGVGYGFLAMVIGYLPVLYQAFSRREVNINLLDSRAGSPPSALYFFQQLSQETFVDDVKTQLENWEGWCAELLETHLSYPVLAYYRSQHDDQSWVAALLMILDTSALILVSKNHELHSHAKATFAIARHAAADLTEAFYLDPREPDIDRLSRKDLVNLRKMMKDSSFLLREGLPSEEKLIFLRKLYEPHMQSLSNFFLMPMTPFISNEKVQEAWRKDF